MNPTIKARIEKIKNGEVPEGYKRTKIGIVPTDWKERKLKNYFTRLTRKNAENNQNVLTISAQYGLISQEDFFNKSVASEDKSNYFLLLKGDFAYNKSYSNGYPYGAIKRLEYYEKGIVSPLYICMEPQNSFVADYFVQYFEGGLLNGEIHAFAQEGARNHGLLNIAVDDFFNTNVVVPCEVEQQRIAEILATQDKVIELKEKLLKEKQRQKKYLMQQLLTGKKRLPGFSGEWKELRFKDVFDTISSRDCQIDKLHYLTRGLYPIVDQSKNLIAGYSNDGTKLIKCPAEGLIIFGDHTREVKFVNFDFIAGADGTQILTSKVEDVQTIYLYYALQETQIPNDGYSRHFKYVKSAKYCIPSLQEQSAIAQILSTADKEIELLKKDIEQEKLKKKSLMQLLLTGIVRVNEVAI